MSDYSSYYKFGYAYSQLGADPAGPNRVYNCVEASFEECFAALGYAWMHPQRLTDLVYGVGHHGGSDFTFVRDKILALGLYPGAPAIEVSNPDDTIGALRAALTAGYPVIIEFKDDLNSQLVPQWHANWHGTHASPVVEIDDKTVSILNVWDGSIQAFSHDTMRQATLSPAGNMVVFKRSLMAPSALIQKHSWEDDTLQIRLSAEHPSENAIGLFDGKPGDFLERHIYVAAAGDTFIGTKDGTVVRFYFVPASGNVAEVKTVDLTVSGSQQLTAASPLQGEQHIRAELIKGGPVDARAYAEFK